MKNWSISGFHILKNWSIFLAKEISRYSSQFARATINYASIAGTHIAMFAMIYQNQILIAAGGMLTGAALYALIDHSLRGNQKN